MVALFGLLEHDEVVVELLLGAEGDAVDAGEHLVAAVVLPVRAGLLGDLEGLQRLGVQQMGPEAHVDVLALLEEAELALVGQIVHMLELVLLAALGHELLGLLAGQHEGLEGQVLLHDLLHFLLDGLEILGRELALAQVDVVIEAVLGRRTVGEVRLREQALDGLRHDVGRGVAKNVQLLLRRALFDMAVLVNDLHVLSSPVSCIFIINKRKMKTPSAFLPRVHKHGSTLRFYSGDAVTSVGRADLFRPPARER